MISGDLTDSLTLFSHGQQNVIDRQLTGCPFLGCCRLRNTEGSVSTARGDCIFLIFLGLLDRLIQRSLFLIHCISGTDTGDDLTHAADHILLQLLF